MSNTKNEQVEVALSHDEGAASFKEIDDTTPESFAEVEHADPVPPAVTTGPQIPIPEFVTESVADSVADHLGFDPAIHAVNPDGTPKLTVDGAYAKKRGRRKVVDTAGENRPEVSAAPILPGNPGMDAATVAAMSNAQTALFLVRTTTGVLSRAIGPEWAAEKGEEKGLSDAVKQYLDAKGGIQISPEMGLTLALAAYAVPRLATENTQSKLSRFAGWCRDRFDVIRARLSRARGN